MFDREDNNSEASLQGLATVDMGRLVGWLLVCLIACAGCNARLPGKPNPDDRTILAKNELSFDFLYSHHCAGCHGSDGTHGAAPPLNDPLFRSIVPQMELEMVLDMGRPWESIWRSATAAKETSNAPTERRSGTAMAAFAHGSGGPLSTAQVQILVQEIKGVPYRIDRNDQQGRMKIDVVADAKGIEPRWGTVSAAPPNTPPYVLPDRSGNAERGKALFAAACASCHGENGAGDDRQRNRINDVNFLSLISDQALRRIIITGRPDLKMPDYTDKSRWPNDQRPLNAAEIADIGALLSSWRAGTPAKAK